MKNNFLNINESEKDRIKNLYVLKPKKDYVFECVLSTDNQFFILQDDVFDIKEQKYLGYIWESIDIFKQIFTSVNIDNDEYKQIQENWGNLPILENKSNLYELRDLILEFNFFNDTWLGRQTKQSSANVKDSISAGLEGLKDFGVSISRGEWSEILGLLKKGVVWVLRKLKNAAYSTLGAIVDSILIATGIGKGFQMATWGLITALDSYQILNNDWAENDNREPIWKYLDLGFDLLGLVFAGVAAKGARAVFKPLSGLKTNQLAKHIQKNPKMKKIIQQIYTATKSGASKLKSLQTTLTKKWPNGSKFINMVLGGFEKLMSNLRAYCGQILSKSNLKVVKPTSKAQTLGYKQSLKKGGTAAGVSGGMMYGMEKMLDGENDNIDFSSFDISTLPISDKEF